MTVLKALLGAMLIALLVYTVVAVANDGVNLVPHFFGAVSAMGWAGQFNLDFMCYLILSALWVAWRHSFSAAGLGLAAVASVGGILFLSVYLLFAISKVDGDMTKVLLGDHATS